MAANLGDAEAYIEQNVIALDDWAEADEAKKQRLLTVADRTLTGRYVGYTIPDDAVYEYAAVLATVFNDNGLMKRQGVAGFAVTGVASFTFANTGRPSDDIARFIPKAATDIINASNAGLPSVGGRVKWTVI
jgi:hypothetical protein